MAKKKGKKGSAAPVPEGETGTSGPPIAAAGAAAAAAEPAPAAASPAQQVAPGPVDEVTKMLNDIRLSGRFNTELAKKPVTGPGKLGKPVTLLTNMFRIKVTEDAAYHYDVTFQLEKKDRTGKGGDAAGLQWTVPIKVRSVVTPLFELLKTKDKDFLQVRAFFDGKQNMYTVMRMMPSHEKEVIFDAEVDGEKRKAKVKYTFTGHSLNWAAGLAMSQDALQALEIGLGYEIGRQMIQRGSKFFERSSRPTDVGMNLELRMGFVKSVKATEQGLCINLDRAAALFQKGGNLTDVMMNLVNFGSRPNQGYTKQNFILTRDLRDNLERELSNLRIEFRNPKLGYQRKVRLERGAFTQYSVSQIKFDWIEKDPTGKVTKEVRGISVFDYFKQKHKVTLQYPNLPCLAVGKDKKNNLPVELCHLVPEQYYDKKMSDKIQAQVTKATIQDPRTRYGQIMTSQKQMVPLAKATVGCDISLEPVQVVGRIIDPPGISFKNQVQVVNPRGDGKFMNPCDFKWGTFNAANRLDNWTIVQVQDSQAGNRILNNVHPQIMRFGQTLSNTGNKNGFPINTKFGVVCFNYVRVSPTAYDYPSLQKFMRDQVVNRKQQLLLFVMPADPIYSDIKKAANELGVTTQCLKLNVDDRFMMDDRGKINKICGATFVNNMLMKMNAKFGGINAKLAPLSMPPLLKKRVMVVGMDVFHPGPGSTMQHSLAGIVASYTPCFTKYFQQAKAQRQNTAEFKRQEEITKAVFEAMTDFFKRWKQLNGFFPENVIVFRDGVSEGQFDKVRIIELDQIYRAMQQLGFKAKVTFITVQKRHHFRMFETGQNGYVGNPQPGTVIDKDVVHPVRFECYLNSHHALKGTSKPCHYCVVHNECGLSSDEMQQIAYYLCYLCARCYKPISIPIPVKYAHLVSEQASKSLESAMRNKLRGTVDEWIRVHENFSDKLNYA